MAAELQQRTQQECRLLEEAADRARQAAEQRRRCALIPRLAMQKRFDWCPGIRQYCNLAAGSLLAGAVYTTQGELSVLSLSGSCMAEKFDTSIPALERKSGKQRLQWRCRGAEGIKSPPRAEDKQDSH